ncbi:dUTP diphosphatase [Lactococcus lactis]|uniref:dUTP diphosphatase n=1 Tax=Lactococcus lactis TaxID=1358 RepID=UPI00345BD281
MKRQFVKLNKNATIPERATEHSAGYDIAASETVTIQPDEIKMVSTGLAVQLGHDEVLKLYDRSSNPVKRGIALINSVGIIDSDYYPNEFKGLFMNISKEPVTIAENWRSCWLAWWSSGRSSNWFSYRSWYWYSNWCSNWRNGW